MKIILVISMFFGDHVELTHYEYGSISDCQAGGSAFVRFINVETECVYEQV